MGRPFTECVLCGGLIRGTKQTRRYCNNCKIKHNLEDNSRTMKNSHRLAMVKCEECGCSFVVDYRAFGAKKRCDTCQKKHRLDQQRERRKAV